MRKSPLVILVLLTLGACKKDADKDKAPASTNLGAEPSLVGHDGPSIENTPYRFKLAQPGPDWKLLDHDDARQISSDAQAAVSQDTGLTAVVIVEHVPGLSLDQMSKLILDAMPIEGKSITE